MAISVFQQLELAGRALSAQRTRLDVASTNLANAETTRTAEGTPFRRKDVILGEEPVQERFGDALEGALSTVKVEEIRDDAAPPRMVYEPGHPDANADGYVAYPNINTVEEMVNMITTMRTYQANLNAFGAVKEMAEQALGIGRNV
jgi:flagellar basal-body rod protein FlgC